jgi:hypothetical protein
VEDKDDRERARKALFATMADLCKVLKEKNPGHKGSYRNEVEEEVRESMSLSYDKFSIKQLSIEELTELREWVSTKIAKLAEG